MYVMFIICKVDFMQAKVSPPLSLNATNVKHAREYVKELSASREKELLKRKAVEKLKIKEPKNKGKIVSLHCFLKKFKETYHKFSGELFIAIDACVLLLQSYAAFQSAMLFWRSVVLHCFLMLCIASHDIVALHIDLRNPRRDTLYLDCTNYCLTDLLHPR